MATASLPHGPQSSLGTGLPWACLRHSLHPRKDSLEQKDRILDAFSAAQGGKIYLRQIVFNYSQAGQLTLGIFKPASGGRGTDPNGSSADIQGELGAGEVEASWPIREEVKQMTPDMDWRRRGGFKYTLDSVFSRGQL